MRSSVKHAALFVAVTCAVWIAVSWHWRSTQQDMDAGDIVVYLCLLPVVLFALALAVRWAVRSALATQTAAAAAAASVAASTGASGASAASAGSDVPPKPWHLLCAWVNTAGGADVDALLAAIEAGSPRPRPDSDLHDDDGLPVMTARIDELDVETVENALNRQAEAMPVALDGRGPITPSARMVRGLATLSPLIDELAQSLLVWSQQWADAGRSPAASNAAPTAASSPADSDRIVRVLAGWPADWDDAACAAAQGWLVERLCGPLADLLPAPRWSIRTQRMSGTELLAAAGRTLDALQREGRDDPVALLACHSDLDAAGIRALEDGQRLFHSTRRPKVAMAGEGAAVLVVSALDWPADAALETTRVRLTSPVIVRRSQSIESAGRPSSDDAVGAVRIGLARAGFNAATVAKLTSDADQHTARATELFAVTLALLPELDANDDFRLAGTVAGRLEAVAPLVTLACAAAQARETGKPTVALSLADPHWRMAAVLTPDSFAAASAPA